MTVTSSRARDIALFISVLLLLVVTSPRLLVYYQVTVHRVSLVAVTADGVRRPLELPVEVRGVQQDMSIAIERICAALSSPMAAQLTPPGGRLEWTVEFSRNSTRFDQTRLVNRNDCLTR